jgi:hypothetical protein
MVSLEHHRGAVAAGRETAAARKAEQRLQSIVARVLFCGTAFPAQLGCTWAPFLALLFICLRLDEVRRLGAGRRGRSTRCTRALRVSLNAGN